MFTWRAIFMVNVLLGLIAIGLGSVALQPESTARQVSIDWIGAILAFLVLCGLTYGLIEGPAQQWPPKTFVAILASVVCFPLFMIWEARHQHPLVDLKLFRNRNFAATNAATLMLYAGFGGFGLSSPISCKRGRIFSHSRRCGIPSRFPNPGPGFWLHRPIFRANRTRCFMTAGPFLCALGMLTLIRLAARDALLA